MGFEASRAALRFGYESVKEWLASEAAGRIRMRFGSPVSAKPSAVRHLPFLSRARLPR
jgi:hypothetical protein